MHQSRHRQFALEGLGGTCRQKWLRAHLLDAPYTNPDPLEYAIG
jgi:hypothetical protein